MKILVKRILLIFAAIVLFGFLLVVYAYFIEPRRLVVNEQNLQVPNWSAKLDGFKIVAMSDIHGGSHYVSEERIRQIVETANAQNPDLIVLLGDFVSQSGISEGALKMPSEIVIKNLRELRAKHGVYAVIGNHDWYYDEAKMTEEFEAAGISVLENRTVQIKVKDEVVNVWGIEDYWKKRRVPVEPFNAVPIKRNTIALTHNPDSLLKTPSEISLMFAGHSHGGQVSFPFYGGYPFVNDKRFMAGVAVVDGKHIFVTTGIGTTGPPIRFFVPPEIAVINVSAEN